MFVLNYVTVYWINKQFMQILALDLFKTFHSHFSLSSPFRFNSPKLIFLALATTQHTHKFIFVETPWSSSTHTSTSHMLPQRDGWQPLSPRLTARCVTAGEGQTEGDGYERTGRQKFRDELMEVGPVNVKDDQEEDMTWVHETLVTLLRWCAQRCMCKWSS